MHIYACRGGKEKRGEMKGGRAGEDSEKRESEGTGMGK